MVNLYNYERILSLNYCKFAPQTALSPIIYLIGGKSGHQRVA